MTSTNYANIVKPEWQKTEFWLRAIPLLVSAIAVIFEVPDSLLTELENSVTNSVVTIAGLIAAAWAVRNYIAGQTIIKTSVYIPGYSDKTGRQTVEAWMAVVAVVLGLLALFGVITEDQVETLTTQFVQLVEIIVSLIITIQVSNSYTNHRSQVKASVASHMMLANKGSLGTSQ